jgi:DNA-binding CsgD family transcriptional regulator/PAS domain-containing protein
MALDEQLLAAIDRIYESALDCTQWPGLLETIGALIGASKACLTLSSASQQCFTEFGYNSTPEEIARYNAEFFRSDPWLGFLQCPAGTVMTGQEQCPTPYFERTAHYQEFLKVAEVYDTMRTRLETGRDWNIAIAFARPDFLPVFGEAEKRILSLLLPHLQRAIRVNRRLEENAAASVLQEEALNSLAFGIVVIADGGGVLFANRAALEIAAQGDGLALSRTGLAADHPADNVVLEAAQAKTAAGGAGATVAIRRASEKQPYVVTLMPTRPACASQIRMPGADGPGILAVIADPGAMHVPDAEHLMRAFQLSRTEAELAIRLSEGLRPDEIAQIRGVRLPTVRTQLQSIFAKTGTRRQAELAGLVARLGSIQTEH